MDAKGNQINQDELIKAIERLKSGKITDKTAKRPVGSPPITSRMREVDVNDGDEADHNTDKTSLNRHKTGSRKSLKHLPAEFTDINQLEIPEGVFPAPIVTIRALMDAKFSDIGIEKTLWKNYGNGFRDAIREIRIEFDAERQKKLGSNSGSGMFGDVSGAVQGSKTDAKNTGKLGVLEQGENGAKPSPEKSPPGVQTVSGPVPSPQNQ